MPLYEYKCSKCNSHFEKLQKFSDPPLNECAVCHETGGVEKLLSTPAFHLKGGGWYKDGYASSSSAEAKSSSGNSESSSTPSSAKSEPATKTESKPASSSTPSSTT